MHNTIENNLSNASPNLCCFFSVIFTRVVIIYQAYSPPFHSFNRIHNNTQTCKPPAMLWFCQTRCPNTHFQAIINVSIQTFHNVFICLLRKKTQQLSIHRKKNQRMVVLIVFCFSPPFLRRNSYPTSQYKAKALDLPSAMTRMTKNPMIKIQRRRRTVATCVARRSA